MIAWIPLHPRPKGNSRRKVIVRGRPLMVPPRIAKQCQDNLAMLLLPYAPPEPLSCPVWRDAVFVFPVPMSWPKWRQLAALELRHLPACRPDVGNLVKLLDDALEQAGIIADDAQIVGGTCAKTYGPQAGYRILLESLGQATQKAPGIPLSLGLAAPGQR